MRLITVCLFRPFDITTVNERQNTNQQVRAVNASILRLYDYWKEYYGKSELVCALKSRH